MPTSPDFRDLNPYQKMLLIHSIVEEEKEKYDIVNAGLRALSFASPVSMLGGVTTEGAGPGEKINMEFERHHRSAEQTGKMDMSPAVRKAFDNVYNKPKDEKKVLRLTGPVPTDDVLGD